MCIKLTCKRMFIIDVVKGCLVSNVTLNAKLTLFEMSWSWQLHIKHFNHKFRFDPGKHL